MIDQNSDFNRIRQWQQFLHNNGISPGAIDGLWGINTENATKQFQRINNLYPDGIVGNQTIAAAVNKGLSLSSSSEFSIPGQLNAVCDISHHNTNVDLEKAKRNGMLAVFHKATQSYGRHLFKDSKYEERRNAAKAAGIFWGAYHFGAGGDGKIQANAFLDYVKPSNDTLLVLDFERNSTSGETTMSIEEAKNFVIEIKARTGKYPGIYGGALLRENLSIASDEILSQCWLWVAQYGTKPHLPNGWNNYTFWQYTDGEVGPGATPVIGIGKCDREIFNGSREELENFWNKNKV